MKVLRDLAWTIVLLSLLVAVVAAVPIIIGLICFGITAWLIYAGVHDSRIQAKKRKQEIDHHDFEAD